ncbi:MAG: Nucleoporin nup84 [Claussenomyces sp. TS43310]|nr:MAG: Nucleoporin nup84 [Claussenomyces sp. TS43310]
MAPMKQNGNASALMNSASFLRLQHQNLREGSWDFSGSEPRSQESREASEEPGSYEGEGDSGYAYDGASTSQPSPSMLDIDDHEDILHPLREAANRVGREVEKFAEVLDEYNPLKAADDIEREGMALDLIELCHGIALETVERLRDQHTSYGRKKDGSRWRKKMRGFKINQDMDEEMDDADENPTDLVPLPNSTTVDDLRRWEEESQTWDLLHRFAQIIISVGHSEGEPAKSSHTTNRYSSEREVWVDFLQGDRTAFERDTILRWLKDTADDSGEDIDVLVQELQQNAERGDIIAHGWLHTKAAIKNQKRIHVWPSTIDPSSPDVQKRHLNSTKTEPLVTQLDPDATTRQGRKLEAQDQYFERAIWLGCYELLRRGKSMHDIKEWCRDRTEIWRAVSMSGLPDSNTEDVESAPAYTSTALWRRMCFALARQGGADEYERAVYGILSGDFSSVEPVCRTWNDHLFAHYNSLLRCQFEAYLSEKESGRVPTDVTSGFETFDAVQFHGGATGNVGRKVVDSLKRHPKTSEEAKKPMKVLQGIIVGNFASKFVYAQGLALSREANQKTESLLLPKFEDYSELDDFDSYISLEDHDSIRVLAHMYLVYKSLGMSFYADDQVAVENILVAYINFLRLAGKEELIPLYAAQLSEERCYDVLSRTLIDVVDLDQRIVQIKLMRDLGLDVQRFVVLQTTNLLAEYPDTSAGFPADTDFEILEKSGEGGGTMKRIKPGVIGEVIERSDMLLIRSLEWHLLVDGLWSATFRAGITLYKRFFKNVKLAAANMLAASLPSFEICQSKSAIYLQEELDWPGMESEDDFEDVTERHDEDEVRRGLLKRHMVAEAQSYREFESLMFALQRIQDAGNHLEMLVINDDPKIRKEIRLGLFALLGNLRQHMGAIFSRKWLTTSQEDEPQFQLIREAYLPEVILAFDNILHLSGAILSRDNLLESINLSTIIAAEDSDLADMFVKKGRMEELVQTFAEDSTALLEATGPGRGKKGTSKKLKELGWTRDIWDIKM